MSFTIIVGRCLPVVCLVVACMSHAAGADALFRIGEHQTVEGASRSERPGPIAPRFVYGKDREWQTSPYRLAVVLIEFNDTKHDAIHSSEFYDQLLFSRDVYKNAPSGGRSFGSVADWYRIQSDARFSLTGRVFAWVTVDETFETIRHLPQKDARERCMKVACDHVREHEGMSVFDDFDGYLFIHVGPIVGPNSSIFWSHQAKFDGKRYITTGEIERIGVICHEFGHILGLPDMYAKEGVREGFGPWCTMASGYRGTFPKSFCAWSKTRLGWTHPTIVDASSRQKLLLRPIQSHPNDALIVPINAIDGVGCEFLLLENRVAAGNDFEGQAGLFIWQIRRKPDSNGLHVFELKLPGPKDEIKQDPLTRRVAWPFEEKNRYDVVDSSDLLPVSIRDIRLDGDNVFFEVGQK